MKHHAETRITGEVYQSARCHPYAGGVVANFVIAVSVHGHTEHYRCVAFQQLGEEIERSIRPGQIVSVSGWMKTTPWRDDPNKENHQLIANEFRIHGLHSGVQGHSPALKANQAIQPGINTAVGVENQELLFRQEGVTAAVIERQKQLKKQTRQYGRSVKKQHQDFTALHSQDPFNDTLNF